MTESSRSRETLRVEGHLGGPSVGELRRACEGALSNRKRLVLDFAGVSFVDATRLSYSGL
jgi:anti-anti-sigma regulatory factor